jgi:hypothetical protein
LLFCNIEIIYLRALENKSKYRRILSGKGDKKETKECTCWVKRSYMLGQQFVHLKHVSGVSSKNNPKFIIANDLPFIIRILKVILPDVCP